MFKHLLSGSLAALCLLPMQQVFSHEITDEGKIVPILNVGGRYLSTDKDYPSSRLNNALEANGQQAYQQKNALDYIDLGLKVNWTDDLSSYVKASYHGVDLGEELAVEQAWLKYAYDVNHDNMLTIKAGRQNVPLGQQNLEHSHNWLMGVTPLVIRASLAGSWLDDGVQLVWQHEKGWQAQVGAYQADTFPSSQSKGANAITANIAWQEDFRRLQLSLANFNVNGRTTEQQLTQGHSHNQEACLTPSLGQVCFDGQSNIVVLDAEQSWGRLTLSTEAWFKRESGNLGSLSGLVDYTGTVNGAWLTAIYRWQDQWQFLARIEDLQGQHTLKGTNAKLIAQEAGISQSDDTLYRVGIGAIWTNQRGIKLSAELHHENLGQHDNLIFLLRYQIELVRLLNVKTNSNP